jgi:hypothetical protein
LYDAIRMLKSMGVSAAMELDEQDFEALRESKCGHVY